MKKSSTEAKLRGRKQSSRAPFNIRRDTVKLRVLRRGENKVAVPPQYPQLTPVKLTNVRKTLSVLIDLVETFLNCSYQRHFYFALTSLVFDHYRYLPCDGILMERGTCFS
jgi:hypothetical protein